MSRTRPHTASLLALAMLAAPTEGDSKGRARPKSFARPPRSRRGPRAWSGSHDQERERRRRQIERGVIRATPEFGWDVVGPVLALRQEEEEVRRQAQRDELLAQGERLVRHIARQLRFTARISADHDLVVPGMVGLQHAVDTFDPDRGLTFSIFAAPRIRGAILDHLRRTEAPHARP